MATKWIKLNTAIIVTEYRSSEEKRRWWHRFDALYKTYNTRISMFGGVIEVKHNDIITMEQRYDLNYTYTAVSLSNGHVLMVEESPEIIHKMIMEALKPATL